MKILVTGSSGMIGTALARSLTADGHRVVRLLRQDWREGSPHWDPERGVIDLGDASDVEGVVHLAGQSLSDGRWNARTKARILNSRTQGTRLLSAFFAASPHKPRVIVSASGIGIYGDCGEAFVDEESPVGRGFLAEVAQQWEEANAPAIQAGIRVVAIRLGVVLSSTGGALRKMLPPFKLGLGGPIGSGNQYMSWVSLEDAVQMIRHVLATDTLRGPVNLVSPNPVTNGTFAQTLGKVLHRPAKLRVPAFAARLAFGEMADALLLSSTRARPQKLMESGYAFRHPELEETLRSLLGRPNEA